MPGARPTVRGNASGLPAFESLTLDVELRVDGELLTSGVQTDTSFEYLDVPTGQVEFVVVNGGWYNSAHLPTGTGGSGVSSVPGAHDDASAAGCNGAASGTLTPDQVLVLTAPVTCFPPDD